MRVSNTDLPVNVWSGLLKRVKISGAHCLMDNSDCVDMLVRVGHESDKGLGGTKKK